MGCYRPAVTKPGCLLEHPSIRHYYSFFVRKTALGAAQRAMKGESDNVTGADDQQETGNGILRDCTRGAAVGSAVKRQSDPHGDMGSQTEMF